MRTRLREFADRMRAACHGARRASSRMRHPPSGRASRTASSSREPIASIACVPLTSDSPSFDAKVMRFDARGAERFSPAYARPFSSASPSPIMHQRHVCERGEIPARASAALRWNHRRDAVIEKVAQPLGNERPDTGAPDGQHVCADEHHGPDHRSGQRWADADGVGTNHIPLQVLQLCLETPARPRAGRLPC